jgi:hypothetical protein
MSGNIKFVSNGRHISRETAAAYPVITVGYWPREPDTVQVFDSEGAFFDWGMQTDHAKHFAYLKETLPKLRSRRTMDNSLAFEQQKRNIVRIKKDLVSLSARTGLAMGSEELFRRATVERDPLEPSIFDPTLLFEDINASGDALPLPPGPHPDFRLLGWNDQAGSAIVCGICHLFEDTWWRGRLLSLRSVEAAFFFIPTVFSNFSDFSFNDVASSAMVPGLPAL